MYTLRVFCTFCVLFCFTTWIRTSLIGSSAYFLSKPCKHDTCVTVTHTHTHTHYTHNHFTALFLGIPRWAGARRNLLLDLMVQGKITDTDTPTIWMGTTPSGLISDPPPSFPHFKLDALPAATLPFYPSMGQAPNMLACIPTGMVRRSKS